MTDAVSERLPKPNISPSPDAAQFWDGSREHKLLIPQCRDCTAIFFYPRGICPRCGSREISFVAASGRGTLYSFCVQHHSKVPGYAEATPFVTALVDLREGPRMMSLLLGAGTDPAKIRIGSEVRVDFLDVDGPWPLPVFRPA